MAKTCTKEGCSNPVFGGGYCKWHQGYRADKKKPKPLNKVSDKEVQRLYKYGKARKEYLKENPICEVKGCDRKATQIHHKKGRVGELLYNKEFFFATHIECHTEIETNPEWAYKNGYSIRRNGTNNQ